MVIDTSAIMAILQSEPEAPMFAKLIEADSTRCVSSVSMLEAGILQHHRRGPSGIRQLDELIGEMNVDVVPFDGEQCLIARTAYAQFGKGAHAARLNFGDCASYALSKATGEPLLYKGTDFMHTDIESAIR